MRGWYMSNLVLEEEIGSAQKEVYEGQGYIEPDPLNKKKD